MGRYGNETIRVGDDVGQVIDQYAPGGKTIDCKGRKLAANDLGISTSELDNFLENYHIEKAQMKRGKS